MSFGIQWICPPWLPNPPGGLTFLSTFEYASVIPFVLSLIRGQYKSLQALRQDFELMCLNALVFNKIGDEYWTEARSFFVSGSQLFDSQERKSHSTAYAAEIAQIFTKNVCILD